MWITAAAIFLGPLAGVIFTFWFQGRKSKFDAKNQLFMQLMAHRRSYPISIEKAAALNLLDIVFADHPNVVTCWHDYQESLRVEAPNQLQIEDQIHKELELFQAIARTLGYDHLRQIDLAKFYIPSAHLARANMDAECQLEFLRVLKDTARFQVDPRTAAQSEKDQSLVS